MANALNRAETASTANDSITASFAIFCLFTFIVIARPQDYFPWLEPLRPALVLTIVSVASTLLGGLGDASRSFRNPATKLYLFFFGVMVATIPFSIHRRLSFDFVLQAYLVNVVYFLLFLAHVNTFAKLKRILLVIVVSGLVFTALALQFGSFSGGRYFARLGVSRRGRVIGVGFDPNDIAFVVVSLLSSAVCLVVGKFGKTGKILGLSTVALGVLLALFTGSRGGVIGLLTFLALFLVTSVPGVSRTGRIVMILALTAVASFNTDKMNVDRYLTLSDISTDYNATDEFGRLAIWQRGLEMLRDAPLTGVGVGRFGQAIGEARKEEGVLPKWQASHNSYIQVLAELGVFGGGAFLVLLVSGIVTLFKLRRTAELTPEVRMFAAVLLVGFVAQLVTGFFLSQAYSMFYPLSMAMITALRTTARPPLAESQPLPVA